MYETLPASTNLLLELAIWIVAMSLLRAQMAGAFLNWGPATMLGEHQGPSSFR